MHTVRHCAAMSDYALFDVSSIGFHLRYIRGGGHTQQTAIAGTAETAGRRKEEAQEHVLLSVSSEELPEKKQLEENDYLTQLHHVAACVCSTDAEHSVVSCR